MSLAELLKQASAGGDDKAPARKAVSFSELRSAMRSDDVTDDKAEALFHAYIDRLNGETETE